MKKTNSKQLKALHLQAVGQLKRAHAPYSKFYVGAALLTKSGKVFTGCNVENASYGGCICAERTAILKAVSDGHKEFSGIVIVTKKGAAVPPCGMCLQVMAEFFDADTKLWLGNRNKVLHEYVFTDLLPFPFGPAFLEGK